MIKRPRGIVVIGGFRQDLGLSALNERLCDIFPDRRSVRLYSRKWNTDVRTLAQEIRLAHSPASDLRVIAFSWGNPTAMNLARELRKSQHKFMRALLCDPVPRSFGFLPFGTIMVPPNVHKVDWLYQTNMPWWLRTLEGKAPVAESKASTYINRGIPVALADHIYMDDSEEFITAAIAVATAPIVQ